MSLHSSSENQSRENPIKRKQMGLPALGAAISAAKRGRHSFVMLSLENAQVIHQVTRDIHIKAYKKKYNLDRRLRLKSSK